MYEIHVKYSTRHAAGVKLRVFSGNENQGKSHAFIRTGQIWVDCRRPPVSMAIFAAEHESGEFCCRKPRFMVVPCLFSKWPSKNHFCYIDIHVGQTSASNISGFLAAIQKRARNYHKSWFETAQLTRFVLSG